MEGSVVEDVAAPDSWEVADLDETMSRLMLSTARKDIKKHDLHLTDTSYVSSAPPSPSLASVSSSAEKASEDAINQIDQFLREALQNPRERLSILRIEQDIEKFIRDPTRQQLEFQQLPTSYLRLAAHRVAQHYSLQSMVLSDNCLPDGSGSKIIVYKTSECQLPMIRLADIPLYSPSEESGVVKVAIKQRPQKRPESMGNGNSNSMKSSGSKSVEERKEEYNRARARIFNSSNDVSNEVIGRVGTEPIFLDNSLHGSFRLSKIEEKPGSGVSDVNSLIDSSMSNSRMSRSSIEKEPFGRYRPNSRVAIFRDREVDRKDPDYDRSYDRYMQRFDPGFGFNGGPYAVQAMYAPALNYNTEFPQLGSPHRPQISSEHQPRPIAQHLPGTWVGPSAPAGIGYGHGHLETMMTPFNPNVGTRSSSAVYLHSSQYLCQRPGMPFIHPHEQVLQPYSQVGESQRESKGFGKAAWIVGTHTTVKL